MFRISYEEVALQVDQLGFIRSWGLGDKVLNNPSYLVFFKDYSRLDPLCRHWDTNQPVDNIQISSRSISYSKQVEEIQIHSQITAVHNGWDWHIEIQGSHPPGHRLGLAVACLPGTLKTIDKPVSTSIAQYCRLTQEVFSDQTFLDLPLVYQESESMFVLSSDMKHDCQFFSYDNEKFNRITVSTSLTNSTTVSVRVCDTVEELKSEYLSLYPESDMYINKWKPMLQNLRNSQKIEITYQHGAGRLETAQDEITVEPIDETDLDKYIRLTHQELNKYPPGFLSGLGIDGILLCSDITLRGVQTNKVTHYHGFVSGLHYRAMSWILWDVTTLERWIIHHEIFHFLDNKVKLVPGGSCMFSMTSQNSVEHAADLYALMMVDRERFKQLATPGSWHKEQSEHIMLKTKELFSEEPTDIQDSRVIWMTHETGSTKIQFGEMPPITGAIKFTTEMPGE